MMGWNGMGAWGWMGMLFMLLFWFGLIALLIAALGGFAGRGNTRTERAADGDHALAILRERFARGEITAEEYDRARQVLSDRSH